MEQCSLAAGHVRCTIAAKSASTQASEGETRQLEHDIVSGDAGQDMLSAGVNPPLPQSLRLYVIDCGTLHIDDLGRFRFTAEEVAASDLSVTAFLIFASSRDADLGHRRRPRYGLGAHSRSRHAPSRTARRAGARRDPA